MKGRQRLVFSGHRIALPLVVGALALGCRRDHPGDVLLPPANAAEASVTPRTAVPSVARELTDAFASAATAIRPSVVRVDVDMAAPRTAAARGRAEVPPDMPDFIERFFHFGDFGELPMPAPAPSRGTGSGVIIDAAGSVLTNAHVAERAGKVSITLESGKKLAAHVVGRDPMTDIAVVKIDNPPKDLVVARVGDAGQLRVGEWVLAVGSPLGMHQTVTAGIVSGLGQTGRSFQFTSGQRVRNYIQTDAKINPGNSGGPLLNLAGEVVGINTLINIGPGGSYGFAIPINQGREVAATLLKEGRVRYPYLGVMIGDVDDIPAELRDRLGPSPPAKGAVVTSVTPGSPAAKAGLKVGDVITRIGQQQVAGPEAVIGYVGAQKIGNEVEIEFTRAGKRQTARVALGELPVPGESAEGEAKVGVRLQTLTPDLARGLGVDPDRKGAVVTEVMPGSVAEAAGLSAGDVIIEVDRKAVNSAEAAVRALHAAKGSTLLRVVGSRGARFVTLDLGVG
jgi:serine protease Do